MKKLLSVVVALLLVVSTVFVLVACKDDYVADNTEHYDDITKSLKFNLSYEGKSFINDGVGEVRLDAPTDGDTTRFYSDIDGTFSVRYYSIDTPESTGGVEKWGKAASNFVKERLTQATVIVLESSEGGAAKKDSYGTRWLGYVWYKTATEDFKLLNLEIVENGYSKNKGDSTNKFKYNSYFVKAEQFARSIQLRLFSKLADPLYNSDPVEFTIKDFKNNQELFYNPETESGAKVIFVAYLKDLSVSSGGWHTFVAAQYDEETGTEYTIDVYTGGSNATGSAMKIGHLYTIIGSLQKQGSGFQISGITYNPILSGNGMTTVEKENYYLTFNDSKTNPTAQWSDTLYGNVKVTSVSEPEDGVLTFTGTATKTDATKETKTFTFKLKVPEGYNNEIAKNNSLKIGGLQLTEGVITIITYSK